MAGSLLAHLGHICKEARLEVDLRQIDISTAAGVDHSVVSRFERALRWPQDPERLIDAYASETGLQPVDLWLRAIESWSG